MPYLAIFNRSRHDSIVNVTPRFCKKTQRGNKVQITGLKDKADTYKDGLLGRIELGGRYGLTDRMNAYANTYYTYGKHYESFTGTIGLSYAF